MESIDVNEKSYISWDYLCPIINSNLNLNYSSAGTHSQHKGLSVNGKLPHSISEYEFNYVKSFIIKHNLTSGFDLSTGTGISALAMGLGMKETNGSILSVDSYVEFEQSKYVQHNSEIYGSFESESFINNKNLIRLFGLKNMLTFR